MTTIKSYTDINQSKKLAEILPLESADMYYFRQIDNDYFPPNVESICPIPLFKDGKEDFNYDIRCWSLAALLGVFEDKGFYYKLYFDGVSNVLEVTNIDNHNIHEMCYNDYSINACVAMIEKLHKLNL